MEPVYALVKGVVLPPLRFGLRWTVEDADRIPERGPVLLASNHVSYLDPFVVGWVADGRGRKVRFLAKNELFEKRVVGWIMHSSKHIPVRRGLDEAADALSGAVDALRRGECVVMFPEGTISLDLEPMAGKTGTARLAQAAGVPVTPVGVWGVHRVLFKGRKPHWQWGVPQTAVVGEPVPVGPDDDVREATDRIMAAICGCVARARELYPEEPGDRDEWWWRPPDTARVRSCRVAGEDPEADLG